MPDDLVTDALVPREESPFTTLDVLREGMVPSPDDMRRIHAMISREYLDAPSAGSDLRHAPVDLENLRVVSVNLVRFRKPADIHDGLLGFLTSVHQFALPFMYFLARQDGEFRLHVGIMAETEEDAARLKRTSDSLESSLRGFFPGCEVVRLHGDGGADTPSKRDLRDLMLNLRRRRVITGIPGRKDDEKSRPDDRTVSGLELLADAIGEDFALLVYARPVSRAACLDILQGVESAHDAVHAAAKIVEQNAAAISRSRTDTASDTVTVSEAHAETASEAVGVHVRDGGIIRRMGSSMMTTLLGGRSPSHQETTTEGTSDTRSQAEAHARSEARQEGDNRSRSFNTEKTSKMAANLEKMLDRMHARIHDGMGMGMWFCLTEVFAADDLNADKIARQICGHWSGRDSALDPLRFIRVHDSANHMNLRELTFVENHILGPDGGGVQTLLTTNELARSVQLPLHEIPGIPVEKLCDFGRNWRRPAAGTDGLIRLGRIADRGGATSRPFEIAPSQLLRHCFVSGATGSGKSNTMRRLLMDLWNVCKVPFMVIEPAKSEYPALQSGIDGMQASIPPCRAESTGCRCSAWAHPARDSRSTRSTSIPASPWPSMWICSSPPSPPPWGCTPACPSSWNT